MGNGKFTGVMLVSDFDDTLYGTDLHVSEENRAAIRSFIAQGGLFTVATGRARKTFSPQVELEDIPLNAPVILSNGATIFDYSTQQMVRRTYLPDHVIDDMLDVCAKFPELGFEAYYQNEIYVYNPNIVTEKHMKRVGMAYSECAIKDLPMPLTKIILEQEPAYLREVQAYMQEKVGIRYEVIFSNVVLLELTAKGSHKGGSTLWLANHLGIDPQHLYCVGDNQNDIPMLEVARIGFAPEDCSQSVKDWGGARLVRGCNESSIAAVIEILDQIY